MSEYLSLFQPEEQKTIVSAYYAVNKMKENPYARKRHDDFVKRRDALLGSGVEIQDATVTALMDDPEAGAASIKFLDAHRQMVTDYGLLARQVSDIDFELTLASLRDDAIEGEYFENSADVFKENFFSFLGRAYSRGMEEGYSEEVTLSSTRMAAEVVMLEKGIDHIPADGEANG